MATGNDGAATREADPINGGATAKPEEVHAANGSKPESVTPEPGPEKAAGEPAKDADPAKAEGPHPGGLPDAIKAILMAKLLGGATVEACDCKGCTGGVKTYLITAGGEKGECVFTFVRADNVREALAEARKLIGNKADERQILQAVKLPVDHYELS
jgi:hypothetical protein